MVISAPYKKPVLPIDETLIVRADPRFHKNPLHPIRLVLARVFHQPQMTPSAFLALQQLLDLPDRPTALFVTNNQMTLGTLHAFKERKLRCPEDISLISFDDHDWAPLFAPPLTVVRQPTYQLGQTVAKLLMKLINHQEFENPSPLPGADDRRALAGGRHVYGAGARRVHPRLSRPGAHGDRATAARCSSTCARPGSTPAT